MEMRCKYGLLLMLLALITACHVSEETLRKREQQRQQVAMAVEQHMREARFKVEVNTMLPARGGARHLTSVYSIEVNDGEIISYLPYFGRAYNVPYGGGKGLNFKGKVVNYQVVRTLPDKWNAVIDVENEEGPLVYYLEVFDNGNATLTVDSRERERVIFIGAMVFEE